MATYGWGTGRPVKDGLFEEGHRFAFLQAVHLLELLHQEKLLKNERTAPGEGIDPERELVRFRHRVRLDFPPVDVENVVQRDGDAAEMLVNVLGLAGVGGPLPHPVTELLLTRSFRGDNALRDFLDIFHHRMTALLYRARKKYRPALGVDTSEAPDAARSRPDSERMARVLYSFIGIGTDGLRKRLDVPDRSLLEHAGLFVDRYRSMTGLEQIIEHVFGVPVEIAPFQGRWESIDTDDQTALGRRGQNQRLGHNAVLGGKIWNESASCEVRLGPLPLLEFLSFLPTGHAYLSIVSLVRFYTRLELGFKLRLALRAKDVGPRRLGSKHDCHLGWTSWLRSSRAPLDRDTHVTLLGKS